MMPKGIIFICQVLQRSIDKIRKRSHLILPFDLDFSLLDLTLSGF